MEELDEEVDWTSGHWRSCALLEHRIATQFTSKVYVFSDSVLCLGGKSPEHPEGAKNLI